MISMKLVDFQFVSEEDGDKTTHYQQELVPGKFSEWYEKKEKKIPSIKVTAIWNDVDEIRKNTV